MTEQGLRGLRVLSLESRRAAEMKKLIENYGGTAVSAPSMREAPLTENSAALAFAEQLLAGRIDCVLFLTGVGTRILFGAMESKHSRQHLVDALAHVMVIVRGPKPAAALREFGVPISLHVPEPNTWRDILKALDEHEPPLQLAGKRIAVQEYGVSNGDLLAELSQRGALVTRVPVYQWTLPADIAPLRNAINEIANGRIDVLLVTSATQVEHLMLVASDGHQQESVRQGLARAVVASIGPIATEALAAHGIRVDFEPSHPKMGQLVFEAAHRALAIVPKKKPQP
jgi:uroporphyrinogen-III synthase